MEFSKALVVRTPARLSLAVGFAVAVLIASMMHAPADPLSKLDPLGMYGVDKWIHFWSYALVAFLGAYVALTRSLLVLLAIVLVTTAFGAGVEVIQGSIEWRTMEFADGVANGLGAVLGAAVWWLAWTILPIDRSEVTG